MVKGAIAGGIIGLIFLIIVLIGGGFAIIAGGSPAIANLLYVGMPFTFLCKVPSDFIAYSCTFLSPIINLAIVGAIIGLIVGKIRSKK